MPPKILPTGHFHWPSQIKTSYLNLLTTAQIPHSSMREAVQQSPQGCQLWEKQSNRAHNGLPQTIVSDRDSIFLSQFWKEWFKLLKVQLQCSSSYHPQTDGQTEVVNRCLENYLRCMTSDYPKAWYSWLPLAEYWYNTNLHSAIKTTPFQIVYGQAPPVHTPYLPGSATVDAVDMSLAARERALHTVNIISRMLNTEWST